MTAHMDPGAGEARPVLSLSKGRDDDCRSDSAWLTGGTRV